MVIAVQPLRRCAIVTWGFLLLVLGTAAATAAARAADVTDPKWWVGRLAVETDSFPLTRSKPDPAGDAFGIDLTVRRADLLAGLAKQQARLKDGKAARASIARCEEALRQAPHAKYDPFVHAQLAGVHATLNDLPAARASIDSAFAALAKAADPDGEKAADQAGSLERLVISVLTEAGAYEEAVARVSAMPSAASRAFGLQSIAKAQHKAGGRAAARKTLGAAEAATREACRTMSEQRDRDDELTSLFGTLVELEELGRAERLVAELSEKQRPGRLVTLAAKSFDLGDKARYRRLSNAAAEALRQLPRNDFELQTNAPRLAALYQFVGDKAAAERTLALVKGVKGATMEVEFNYAVALLRARAGDAASSREAVDRARAAEAKEAAQGFEVMKALRALAQPWPAKIALAHIDAGRPEEALRMLEQFAKDEINTASLRTVLILARATAGDLPAVRRDLEKLDPGMFSRDLVRGQALKALARTGDAARLHELATWIESMPEPVQRVNGYLMVVEGLQERKPPPR